MATQRLPWRVQINNIAVFLLGLAAIGFAAPHYPASGVLTLFLFAALGAVANIALIPTAAKTLVSLSDAVFLATALALGPGAAAYVIVAAVTAGALARRSAPPRQLWLERAQAMLRNYGMYMLMVVLAGWVYARLGGLFPIEYLTPGNYLAAAGFIVTYQLVNRLLIYAAVLLRGSSSLRQLLSSEPQDMPLELLSLHIGLLIAITFVHSGFAPLVIFGAFIFGVSFLLRRYVEQLQQRVAQLGALNEIGRAISATVDIPQLMQAIYRESGKVIDTANFYIALYDAQKDQVTFVLDVTDGQLTTPNDVQPGGKGLTGYLVRTRAPLLLPDNVAARTRALGLEVIGKPAQCWVGVPMTYGDKVVGVIAAQNYAAPRAFTQEHVDVLMTIAAQAAIAIENARLLEEVAQQERLRQELALARAIQQDLLPAPPQVPGLFIASRCLPAQETGGDLFDFIWIDDQHLGIAIGDVVGKGMPAALLMATVRSVLRAYAQNQLNPEVVLEAVNRVMYDDTRGKTFVSMCYVVLDTLNWTITFASAGHLSPLLCGNGHEPAFWEGPGCLPLGIRPDVRCGSQTRALQPGQTILLYTDGVVEAHDDKRQLFGFEALRRLAAHQPAERLIDAVLDQVVQFAGPVAQEDDLTLVVIQRTETDQ